MNKFSLPSIARYLQVTVTKHSPEILTGLGIAGMATATVMAVQATPKAMKLIHKAEKKKKDGLTKVEVVKETWKCYIPATLTGTFSIACLVGASSVHLRRNAALATAYTLSETALKEYQDAVIETIGEEKEQVVRDRVAKEHVERNPVSSNQVTMLGKGEVLCYDMLSDRYFYSDKDSLEKAENELNRRMRDEMFISLNDFYYEIGLNPMDIGDNFGWHIDRGYIELNYSSQLTDEGKPCLAVGHYNRPDYYNS